MDNFARNPRDDPRLTDQTLSATSLIARYRAKRRRNPPNQPPRNPPPDYQKEPHPRDYF